MLQQRIFVLIFLAIPTVAVAQEQIDSIGWGLRAGGSMPHYVDAEFATVAGASVVYRHREFASLALEADVLATLIDGDVAGFDYSTTTMAAYLAWRSAGNFYLKLRAGLLMEYVSVGPADKFGGGLSGGVGAGMRHGQKLIELELTGVEKAVYAVTINWYF